MVELQIIFIFWTFNILYHEYSLQYEKNLKDLPRIQGWLRKFIILTHYSTECSSVTKGLCDQFDAREMEMSEEFLQCLVE